MERFKRKTEMGFYVTYKPDKDGFSGVGQNTRFLFIARLRAWIHDSEIDFADGDNLTTIEDRTRLRRSYQRVGVTK